MLLGGGLLYRDLSIPYGPLGTYAHALLAAIFGNTMLDASSSTATPRASPSSSSATRRSAARPGVATALFVAAFGLIPTTLIPAAPTGGGMLNAYTPIERCVFALAFLAWEPLTRRIGRAVAGAGDDPGDVAVGQVRRCVLRRAADRGCSTWSSSSSPRPTAPRRLAAAPVDAGGRGSGSSSSKGRATSRALLVLPRPVALDVIWPGYAETRTGRCSPTRLDRPSLPEVRGLAVLPRPSSSTSWRRWRSAWSGSRGRRSAWPGRSGCPTPRRSTARWATSGCSCRCSSTSPARSSISVHVFIFMKYYPFLVLATAPSLSGTGSGPGWRWACSGSRRGA